MTDQVDDIEGAEDWIGTLEAFVRKVAALPTALDGGGTVRVPWLDTHLLIREAVGLLGDGNRYCRPTCGFLSDGSCLSGDCCGCPCGHEAEAVDDAATDVDVAPVEGWAKLTNPNLGEGGWETLQAHWWREDATSACETVGDVIYRGPRSQQEPEDACPACKVVIG